MKESVLLDTGFLLAILNRKDAHHIACSKAFQKQKAVLLPDVVLPEVAYLILRELDVKALTLFLRTVAQGGFTLERTSNEDLLRAAEILERYNDNNIDLVDAVIVAMAERLDITRILTVDRRHFGAFRPQHCAAFEILP